MCVCVFVCIVSFISPGADVIFLVIILVLNQLRKTVTLNESQKSV